MFNQSPLRKEIFRPGGGIPHSQPVLRRPLPIRASIRRRTARAGGCLAGDRSLQREAKLSFNVGQGTQDLGFRNETDILFTCQPSTDVKVQVQRCRRDANHGVADHS